MNKERTVVWTVGHSTRALDEFLELLTAQRIQLLADVRQFPGSRRYPQFGQAALSASLAGIEIQYSHFPELGGRRRAKPDSINTAWKNEAFRGYADYMMTLEFKSGIERLLGLVSENKVVLMCAEAVWWRCHRALISDYLKAKGYTVLHILGRDKVEEHPFTSAARMSDGKLSYTA